MRSFIILFAFVFICLCYSLIYFPWKQHQVHHLRMLQEEENELDEFVNMGEYYEIHNHWVLQESTKIPEPELEFKIIDYDHRHLYGLFL
jgi:hypothetical protein